MTVYTCSPDLASILTCIYEAWNSRLGYRNVQLMTEPVGNLELFCDYCHVEPDTEKAASVTRSIQKKIGATAWRLVYLCAMSERSDAPDIIYRFLLYGFSYGKDTLHMLQEPAVFHAFEVSRQVTNEAHSFREFIRFANISSGFPILVSHISPKANVLTLVAPHFSDRLPSENWMILDDNRQLAVVHPADRPFYLTRLSPGETRTPFPHGIHFGSLRRTLERIFHRNCHQRAFQSRLSAYASAAPLPGSYAGI